MPASTGDQRGSGEKGKDRRRERVRRQSLYHEELPPPPDPPHRGNHPSGCVQDLLDNCCGGCVLALAAAVLLWALLR